MSILKRHNEQFVIMTEDLIRAGMKAGCGLKRGQATILGEAMPLKSGWLERSIGKTLTTEEYEQFLVFMSDEYRVIKKRRKKKNRPTHPPNNRP
jgi:hypothetical protein